MLFTLTIYHETIIHKSKTYMKKKTLTLLVFSCSLLTSFAQTAKEEIYADILKSGSNYMAYQAPTKALTKAPKGYEPFYMSHYGRHGSRWLINENDYTSVIRVFRRANELGKLTPLGKEALAKLERFIPTTKGRLGELSDIGEQQHHGIGRRMTENFPEIFSGKDAEVDARSTVVVRCILSMTAECEELTAFKGIGEAKAITILAALEFARRRMDAQPTKRREFREAKDIYDFFRPLMCDKTHEVFWVLLLNNRLQYIDDRCISQGDVKGTVAEPRMIFNYVVSRQAVAFAVAHNHPSGNTKPSNEDDRLTKRIKTVAQELGIRFVDHIIVAEGIDNYYSYNDQGKLD